MAEKEVSSPQKEQSRPGYYAVIPANVRYDDSVPANAKLIYGEISALTNSLGYCYASNAYFAQLYGMTERTVRRLIGSLEKSGYISVEVITQNVNDEKRKIWLSGGMMGGDKNVLTVRTKLSGGGDNFVQGHYIKNNTKNNTPIAPVKITDLLAEYAGEDAALRAALFGFAEMRAKKHKPIATARTVQLLTAKLDKLSGGSSSAKIALLDEATEKGWSSVFAHDDRQGTAPTAKKRGGDDEGW